MSRIFNLANVIKDYDRDKNTLGGNVDKAQQTLKKLRRLHTNDLGCHLTGKARSSKNKAYKRTKPSGQREELYVHHIALVAAARIKDIRKVLDEKYQVHHRCHNPGCFNNQHLAVVTPEENLAAEKCRLGRLPDDRLVTNCHCAHPCILRPEDFRYI